MENLKTVNYLQKRIANFIFNEEWYNRIKLAKIILFNKLGKSYEMSLILKDIVTPDSVILDIGANMGQYACRLHEIINHGKGHIYSFEPVSTNFAALRNMKKILKLNNLSVFQMGVSNVSGHTTIHIPMFESGLVIGTRATLLELDQIKHKTEQVKVTTIDTFVSEMEIEKVDFIKCDTEGNEINVLEGGKQSILKFLPILSFEMSYKAFNINWLLEAGYELFYYDAASNKLRKIKDRQEGNLIFLNQKHLQSLVGVIDQA